MKNFIYFSLLAGSLGLNAFLLNTEVIVKDDFDDEIIEIEDDISVAQSSLKKSIPKKTLVNTRSPDTSSIKVEDKTTDKTTDKSPADYEIQYEQAKLDWKENLTEYLQDELSLNREQVDRYFKLGKQREEEVSAYLAPLMDKNKSTAYMFTIDDNVAIGKINEKFLYLLKDELGRDSYQQYRDYRAEYNKQAVEAGNADFYMEF